MAYFRFVWFEPHSYLVNLVIDSFELRKFVISDSHHFSNVLTQLQQAFFDYSKVVTKLFEFLVEWRYLYQPIIFFQFAQEGVLKIHHFEELCHFIIEFFSIFVKLSQKIEDALTIHLAHFCRLLLLPLLQIGEDDA